MKKGENAAYMASEDVGGMAAPYGDVAKNRFNSKSTCCIVLERGRVGCLNAPRTPPYCGGKTSLVPLNPRDSGDHFQFRCRLCVSAG